MSTNVVVKTSGKRKSREESVAAARRSKARYAARKSALSLSTKFHKFVRSVTFGDGFKCSLDLRDGFAINGTSTGVFDMQFVFSLQGVSIYIGGVYNTYLGLPNNSELTALYDQYRIDWVECQFFFNGNMSNVTSPSVSLPIMYLCKDYDSSESANVQAIQQYATQQTWQLGMERGKGSHTVRVKPNVDTIVYNSAVTSGYGRSKPMFIDTGAESVNVKHYGVKIAYDPIFKPAAATTCGYMTVNFKYHLTMAHSK